MNEEQRKKLIILKSVNKEYIKKLQWKSNVLLQEWLNNLEAYQIISDETIIKHIVKIAGDAEIKKMYHSDIPIIEKNHDYYIIWDNERVPIIKCKGNDIIENWDDVLAVAFDTCFVDCESEQGFLIREWNSHLSSRTTYHHRARRIRNFCFNTERTGNIIRACARGIVEG